MTVPSLPHAAQSAAAQNSIRNIQRPPPRTLLPTVERPDSAADVAVNAFADSINSSTSGLLNPPNPDHGALGIVQAAVTTPLAMVGGAFGLVDTGIALISSAILPSIPLPALTMGTMHIGPPHGHVHPPSLVPPAPMIPLPSIGVAQLAGCASVLIGGLPAIRAGDMGIALTCGSLAPAFEIGTGSSNVFIGGARAARGPDLTLHCNPMGGGAFMMAMGVLGLAAGAMSAGTMVMDSNASAAESAAASAADQAAQAEAAAAAAAGQAMGAATAAAQTALDAAALALQMMCGKDPGVAPGIGAMIPMQASVMIGGFPMPNSLDMAKDLFKAASRLARGLKRRPRAQHGADGDARGASNTSCPRG